MFKCSKNPPNPCLCQRLISSLTPESEFYNSAIVSFVIKPPLWWNYILLLVYFLLTIEYFSLIISFKLSLSLSLYRWVEEEEKVEMISSPGKHILLPPVSSCSLSSLFPVRVAWHYLLEQLLWGTRQTLPLPLSLPHFHPSPFHCRAQKRKQLKGNLLDCLCLYHLREGCRAVMIITHCWIITQNLRFTRAYLSVCRWAVAHVLPHMTGLECTRPFLLDHSHCASYKSLLSSLLFLFFSLFLSHFLSSFSKKVLLPSFDKRLQLWALKGTVLVINYDCWKQCIDTLWLHMPLNEQDYIMEPKR